MALRVIEHVGEEVGKGGNQVVELHPQANHEVHHTQDQVDEEGPRHGKRAHNEPGRGEGGPGKVIEDVYKRQQWG